MFVAQIPISDFRIQVFLTQNHTFCPDPHVLVIPKLFDQIPSFVGRIVKSSFFLLLFPFVHESHFVSPQQNIRKHHVNTMVWLENWHIP